MGRKYSRTSTAETRYVLLRRVDGVPRIAGVYTVAKDGQAAAHRVVHAEADVSVVGRLPPWKTLKDGALELAYGRDAQSWHFTLEPWIVDAEAN